MAFDGITIANLACELKKTLEGGKITKIAQPEKDELLIAIKNNKENYRLIGCRFPQAPVCPLSILPKPISPALSLRPISVCFLESISEAPGSFPSPSRDWSVFWNLH